MKDNHRFRLDVWGVITLAILAMYLLFMVYPLSNLIKMAFYGDNGFTLDHFIKFFSKPYYSSTLVNSFKVSFWATVTSLLVGVPMAYFFALYKIRGKQTLRILIIISSMSAPFVGAYAWILLLGRNGVITNFIKALFGVTPPDIYGFNGMLLVFTTQLFSLIFLYVAGALSKVDNSLLEASENMGCTGVRRFFKVVLPLITPTLLAGALLVFIRALSDFGTPMLMGEGYRTFPVILYTEFVGEVSQNKGFASAIAVIAIVITTVVFSAQNIASKRNSFSMNSLHPIEEKPLHGAKGVLIHVFCYVVVFIVILPQLYVLYTSFKKTSGTIYVDGYSLDSYREMFSRLGRSVQNTIGDRPCGSGPAGRSHGLSLRPAPERAQLHGGRTEHGALYHSRHRGGHRPGHQLQPPPCGIYGHHGHHGRRPYYPPSALYDSLLSGDFTPDPHHH